MNILYAMRRANGDWFAFDDDGRLRMPVFHSRRDAMLARLSNGGMMLFTPTALDGRAVAGLAPAGESVGSYFWLADTSDVNRGQRIEHAQLARLVNGGVEQKTFEGGA